MTRSNTRERRWRFAAAALFLALAPAPQAAAAPAGGGEVVKSLYDALLGAMRNGPALGARGRYAQIAPIIHRVFDMPLMTRLAVGPAWQGLGEAQRNQLAQAFERYIAAIYAERFDNYSGERLLVTGDQPSANGTIVTSQIVKSTGEPVNVNYLMRNNSGAWQIADVYLDGTISELATRRAEFASILRSSGPDGLVQALNAKAEALSSARTTYAGGAIGAR